MGQFVDSRGLALNTSVAAAVQAFDAGQHSFACWRTDAMAHMDAAISADPEFILPKLAKGWILQTARSSQFWPPMQALLAEATPLLAKADAREKAYYDSLTAAIKGRGITAATILEVMLASHPEDLLGHRLVQFELFWNGRADWMCNIAERAAPAWSPALADFGCFQSVRAFSNEEAGNYALAEQYGREAVEIDATDCWGTHAVAHVHAMQGRVADGVAWLEGLSGNWGQANQIGHHLWWHLCLMLLEDGAEDRALALLTAQVRNPNSPLVQAMPAATIDLQNVASLLLRLDLRGVDVGAHWNILAEICAGRINDCGNPFSSAHDMMVLAATGQFDLAEQLLENLRGFVAGGGNSSGSDGSLVTAYSAAGIALCEAILAHRKQDYDQVVALLSPVRHDLAMVGGSHAQRDVFYQVLADGAHRAGRSELIPLLFDDIRRIGFQQVENRTVYRDMASQAA
jgi:hypothetical protein